MREGCDRSPVWPWKMTPGISTISLAVGDLLRGLSYLPSRSKMRRLNTLNWTVGVIVPRWEQKVVFWWTCTLPREGRASNLQLQLQRQSILPTHH